MSLNCCVQACLVWGPFNYSSKSVNVLVCFLSEQCVSHVSSPFQLAQTEKFWLWIWTPPAAAVHSTTVVNYMSRLVCVFLSDFRVIFIFCSFYCSLWCQSVPWIICELCTWSLSCPNCHSRALLPPASLWYTIDNTHIFIHMHTRVCTLIQIITCQFTAVLMTAVNSEVAKPVMPFA